MKKMKKIKILEIEEKAIPKGRPRFTKWGGTYTPDRTRNYEAMIGLKYKEKYKDEPSEKPMKVLMAFMFEPPKSLSKKRREELLLQEYTKKPDLDNLVKAVLDGLNGIAFKDDSQIIEIEARKLYGNKDIIYIFLLFSKNYRKKICL